MPNDEEERNRTLELREDMPEVGREIQFWRKDSWLCFRGTVRRSIHGDPVVDFRGQYWWSKGTPMRWHYTDAPAASKAAPKQAINERRVFHQDAGKALVDEVCPSLLLAMGRIFSKAQAKYPSVDGTSNWWEHRGEWTYSALYASFCRHAFLWFEGKDNDEETGESHLAHAACNISMLYALRAHATDDRRVVTQTED